MGQNTLDAHISDTSTHGVSGNIVGTSDSQTLSNKTLDNTNNITGDAITSGTVDKAWIDDEIARDSELPTVVTDHGDLTGRGDDDHAQYLLASGARAMSGNLVMDDTTCNTNSGHNCYVDGVDVSAIGDVFPDTSGDSDTDGDGDVDLDLDDRYVDVDGDTMTGDLTVSSGRGFKMRDSSDQLWFALSGLGILGLMDDNEVPRVLATQNGMVSIINGEGNSKISMYGGDDDDDDAILSVNGRNLGSIATCIRSNSASFDNKDNTSGCYWTSDTWWCDVSVSCSTDEIRTGCGGHYGGMCEDDTGCDFIGTYPFSSRSCTAKIGQDREETRTLTVFAICMNFDGDTGNCN